MASIANTFVTIGKNLYSLLFIRSYLQILNEKINNPGIIKYYVLLLLMVKLILNAELK